MNKRSMTVMNNVVNLQRQAADALMMLLDNPDDAGLSRESEIQLRQTLDNITLASKSLEQIAQTGATP
jgi:hypothetical protein